MTAAATVSAATLTGRGVPRKVYRPSEFPRLVEAALTDNGDDERGTTHVLYAQDTTRAHAADWYPENVLVVTVNNGWGAAYFRGPDLEAWITRNLKPTNVPDLLFDPEAPALFPSGAVLPVAQIHDVIQEYLRTGFRPACVLWREADRYLTY